MVGRYWFPGQYVCAFVFDIAIFSPVKQENLTPQVGSGNEAIFETPLYGLLLPQTEFEEVPGQQKMEGT